MEDFIKNNKAELDGMKNKSGKNLKKKLKIMMLIQALMKKMNLLWKIPTNQI